MRNFRFIARLDIKGVNLIKGVQLEGLRVIGNPHDFAKQYYEKGIDEIIYMDSVASLYGRNHLGSIIKEATQDIFVPITVGGGIRSISDVTDILRCGADKVAINTSAVNNPNLINMIANKFGSQCVVLSVEAKKINSNEWEVYTHNGREKTGMNVQDWILKCEELGAGELLLTSIDREGTRKGFDLDLLTLVSSQTKLPIIMSGGMGKLEDVISAYNQGADAVAMADFLHFNRAPISTIRNEALKNSIRVRSFD